jgi:hypothetical protein
MPNALFTIDGDSSNQGFDADEGETLSLRLKQLPPAGVSTVLFQVFSPSGFDDSLGIGANPPRSSSGAPTLTLEGATSGQSVSPAAVDGIVTVDMPGEGGHSFIVRCIVNGGMGTLPDGRTGPVPALVHERMIAVRDANGCRAVIATETTQYDDDGWAGALNEMRELLGGGGGGGVPDPLTVGAIFGPDSETDAEAQVRLFGADRAVGIGGGGQAFVGGVNPGAVRLAAFADGEATIHNAVEVSPASVALVAGVAGSGIVLIATSDAASSILLATLGTLVQQSAHALTFSLGDGGFVMLRMQDDEGDMKLGFFAAPPVLRPEVAAVVGTQAQLDSVIQGLVDLGLFTDGRVP